MAYEYLNETTLTNDLKDQERLLEFFQEKSYVQAESPEEDVFDTDLVEILEQEEAENPEPEPEPEDPEIDKDLLDDPDFDETDEQLLAMLFQNNEAPQSYSRRTATRNTTAQGRGVNPNVQSTLDQMTQKYGAGNLGIWGDKSHQARKSDHNTGDAVDLTFGNDENKRQSIISEVTHNPKTKYVISNNQIWQNGQWKPYKGDNPHTGHIHVSMNRQNGGNVLNAETPQELRRGLNDNAYDSARLKLQGTNTIRGLDSKQPVAVTDGSKYKVLVGPQDTAQFNGTVYEKRLQ